MIGAVLCAICVSSERVSPAYFGPKTVAVSIDNSVSVRLRVEEDNSIWMHGFMVTASWQKREGGATEAVRHETIIRGMQFNGWNWFKPNRRTLRLLVKDTRELAHYRLTSDCRTVAYDGWGDGYIVTCNHRSATVCGPASIAYIDAYPELGRRPKWFTMYRDNIWVYSKWREAHGAFVPFKAVYERGPDEQPAPG